MSSDSSNIFRKLSLHFFPHVVVVGTFPFCCLMCSVCCQCVSNCYNLLLVSSMSCAMFWSVVTVSTANYSVICAAVNRNRKSRLYTVGDFSLCSPMAVFIKNSGLFNAVG